MQSENNYESIFLYKKSFLELLTLSFFSEDEKTFFQKEKENLSILSRLITKTNLQNSSLSTYNYSTILINNINSQIIVSFDKFDIDSFNHASKFLHAVANLVKVFIRKGGGEFFSPEELKEKLWNIIFDSKISFMPSEDSPQEFSKSICNNLLTIFDLDNLISGILDFKDLSWERIRKALISQTSQHIIPFSFVNFPCLNDESRPDCGECEICVLSKSVFAVSGSLPDRILGEKLNCPFKASVSKCLKDNYKDAICFHCFSLENYYEKFRKHFSFESILQYIILVDFDNNFSVDKGLEDYLSEIKTSFLISLPSNYLTFDPDDPSFGKTLNFLRLLKNECDKFFSRKSSNDISRVKLKMFERYSLIIKKFRDMIEKRGLEDIEGFSRLTFFLKSMDIVGFQTFQTAQKSLSSQEKKVNKSSRIIVNFFKTWIQGISRSVVNKDQQSEFLIDDRVISIARNQRDVQNVWISSLVTSLSRILLLLEDQTEEQNSYSSSGQSHTLPSNPSFSTTFDVKNIFFSSLLSIIPKSVNGEADILSKHFSSDNFSSLLKFPLEIKDKMELFTARVIADESRSFSINPFKIPLDIDWSSHSLPILFPKFSETIKKNFDLYHSFFLHCDISNFFFKESYDILTLEFAVLTMIDTIYRIGNFIPFQNSSSKFVNLPSSKKNDTLTLLCAESKHKGLSWICKQLLQKRFHVRRIDPDLFEEAAKRFFSHLEELIIYEGFFDFYNSIFQIAVFIENSYSESRKKIYQFVKTLEDSLEKEVIYEEARIGVLALKNSEQLYSTFSSIFEKRIFFLSSKLVSHSLNSHSAFWQTDEVEPFFGYSYPF